jgi:hypothetical protein
LAQWLDSTLDKINADIEVDVSGVGLFGEDGKEVQTILCRPISAAEYQVLKSDPKALKLSGEDKTEYLGMRMTYEMLAKCDKSLTWGAFQNRTSTQWWWCVGGIVNWSASNEGQFFFQLLRDFGITPQEWREMDPRDTAFLANGFAEMKNREHASMKRAQLKARSKRGGR